MRDNADPLDGWSAKDVEMTPYGPAKADIYGKLFVYLRSVLRAFLDRIADLKVSFHLLQMDARLLANHFEDSTFDRIEVSFAPSKAWKNPTQLPIDFQHYRLFLYWYRQYSSHPGALTSRDPGQSTCNPHHTFHECCP